MTIMTKQSTHKHFKKIKKGGKCLNSTSKKEFKPSGKRGRLIVRNLPFKCNEEDLHKLFLPFGNVKDVQLLRRTNNKPVGCGFVEFTSRLDADKAVDKLNGSSLHGRSIYVERAVARDRYDESANIECKQPTNKEGDHTEQTEVMLEMDCDEIKQETQSSGDEESTDATSRRGQKQTTKNLKRGRLVVRNLSFKATVDQVHEHFSPYGEVKEVKLLRRPDNNLVGCGFVQFGKKTAAAKAIYHLSGKPFLGRPIIVDWAIAKDNFKKIQEEPLYKNIKKEDLSDEENKEDLSFRDENEIKSEINTEEESEEEGGENDFHNIMNEEPEENKSLIRMRLNDVDEGKTVFVKNLPFTSDNNEFRICMEQFGPVVYALVCKDKFTEHSKGSGFVKFKTKEGAKKCLSAGTELKLNDNILDPLPALKRSDAEKMKENMKNKKDNRNLYLVKEGLIVAGTKAAKDVSMTDMKKRLQLEQAKTTKLHNLNMFVADKRLVIHNLPATLSDKQLRKIFIKHSGGKAVLQEAKIMRHLKQIDNNGLGISKGFGFITFQRHEDALTALRKINNNPDIFSPSARPIVSFSIENRAALNIKLKRLKFSQQKNPMCKEYKPEEKKIDLGEKQNNQDESHFIGVVAKQGNIMKMRNKHKLNAQAIQHMQDVKKHKRDMKMSRKTRRSEHIKKKKNEMKIVKKCKQVTDKDEAFNKLVDKYKTKLLHQSNKKKKWYDEM